MIEQAVMVSESRLSPGQLAEAFAAFENASETMTRHYEALQRRVDSLNLELEAKNEELRRGLAEREAFGEYQESLLDSLTDGVVAVTSQGAITTINRAAEEMLGRSRDDVAGALLEEAIPVLGRCEAVRAGVERGAAGPEGETVEFQDADGEDRIFELQFRHASPRPDEAPHGLIVMRDVTEIRRLQRAANLKNRLTAMGEMAMNVAHEVRNPLGSIELFASALRQETEGEPEATRLIDFISQGVRSIDNIVGNILMFARQLAPSLEPVDPGEMLDDVLTYARFHMEQKEIALLRDDGAGDARCLGDCELLKQVFLNLLLNATQAMEVGGALTLETFATGRQVVFIVEDTGAGISPDMLSKVFDPFFTTRRRGTGLGLSICHNIIQAHEGTIEVESEAGVGTRFTIRVPKA
jgi:PAS domain S-box-containing protein